VAAGLLARRGHDVTIAQHGEEALAFLATDTFDVVLMDLQMPEMDGVEATAAIRRGEQLHGGHVYIVAMTAHAMKGDRERCLAAGMDGYVSKPIERDLLYAAIEQPLLGSAEPAGVVQAAVPAAVDRDRLMNRLGDDEELVMSVIRVFLDDCPKQLALIQAAFADRDGDRMRIAAHALKGAAANLSAQGLAEAASTLECMGGEGQVESAEGAWQRLALEAAGAIEALNQIAASLRSEPVTGTLTAR
jgi:two-component system, sensor histidine kinase and response regulator